MSSDSPAPLVNPNQDRLKSHFESHAPDAHAKRWDDLWAEGSFLPWDRGHANPALIDALNERVDILGSPFKPDGSRKRALVPGCGKGYDVALFAAHGYDGFGIEVSENAVRVAEAYLKDPGPGPLEGEYKVKDEKVGRGAAKCFLGDFFEDDDGWIKGTGGLQDGFDTIYDNTFLCALHPTMRPAWARRMHQLLAPTGVLICLEFPTYKPPKSGGPPFALPSVVHEELFKQPGENIQYDEEKKPLASDREVAEKTLVRVAHWKPRRTHQVGVIKGEVTDRVSLWKHKGAQS